MPAFSILTMLASQLLIMKLSPTGQGRGQMLIMTVVFGVMFGFYAFSAPAGFSLYYTVFNVVMTLQQLVLKRIYDPGKIRAEVEAEIAERKAARKTKKKVVVVNEADGQLVDKELSESELNRLRLEKARQLDAERYGGDGQDKAAEGKAEKAEKARKLDEEKYGADAGAPTDADGEAAAAGAPADIGDEVAAGEDENMVPPPPPGQKPYKPGRRRRARESREREKEAFAADPRQGENNSEDKED
jgi:hypothetical protein